MRRPHIFHFLGFLAWVILPWLPLFAAEGEGGGAGGQGSGDQGGAGGTGQGGQPGAAAVDVQAEVAKALAAHRDQFSQQLKAATGYDSLDKLQEEQARKSGELDKLLAQRTEENGRLRQQLEQSQISTAILGAASDAVNPAELVELLKGKAKVSAEGVVTVDGKSAQDAVAAYLKANAHHAKPSGGQGSGAGAGAGAGGWQANTPWRSCLGVHALEHAVAGDAPVAAGADRRGVDDGHAVATPLEALEQGGQGRGAAGHQSGGALAARQPGELGAQVAAGVVVG